MTVNNDVINARAQNFDPNNFNNRLYIGTVGDNKAPMEHPMPYWNVMALKGPFDPDNPPYPFEPFVRVEKPPVGPWEVDEGTEYERNANGHFQDVHKIRSMTPQEKATKKQYMLSLLGLEDWTLDDDCNYIPPKKYPNDIDTQYYEWNKTTKDWEAKDIPLNTSTPGFGLWQQERGKRAYEKKLKQDPHFTPEIKATPETDIPPGANT